MATPTQTPNPTPSTPTSVDINTPADQLRQAAVAATAPAEPVAPAAQPAAPAQPAQPAQAAPTQPYTMSQNPDGTVEIKTQYGEVFKGTPTEVLGKLAEAKVNTRAHYEGMAKTAQQQLEELRQQLPQQPQTPAQPTVQKTPEEIAGEQWVQDVLAKSLGYENFDQLKKVMGGVVQTTEDAQAGTLAAAFMQTCPDFPNTPEASEKLVTLQSQLGFPDTVEGLQAAHLIAVQRGMYQPVPVQTQQPASPTPNPTLITGSAPTGAQPEINPYDPKVSLEQVKAWAERARNQ